MVGKLNVIKTELQHRKHHRTSEVGAWLGRLCGATTSTMPCPVTRVSCASSGVCRLWRSVLVRCSQHEHVGWAVSTRCSTGRFRNLVFCILFPTSASMPFILGKGRMRKRARTDLWGAASYGRPYRDSYRSVWRNISFTLRTPVRPRTLPKNLFRLLAATT
jgi:hypothetical protein